MTSIKELARNLKVIIDQGRNEQDEERKIALRQKYEEVKKKWAKAVLAEFAKDCPKCGGTGFTKYTWREEGRCYDCNNPIMNRNKPFRRKK